MAFRASTKYISMEMVTNYDKESIERLSDWVPSHFQIKLHKMEHELNSTSLTQPYIRASIFTRAEYVVSVKLWKVHHGSDAMDVHLECAIMMSQQGRYQPDTTQCPFRYIITISSWYTWQMKVILIDIGLLKQTNSVRINNPLHW